MPELTGGAGQVEELLHCSDAMYQTQRLLIGYKSLIMPWLAPNSDFFPRKQNQ